MLDKRQVMELLPEFAVSPFGRPSWHYGVQTAVLVLPALEESSYCDLQMPPLYGSSQRLVAARAEVVIPCCSQVPWPGLPVQPGNLTALQEILAANRLTC